MRTMIRVLSVLVTLFLLTGSSLAAQRHWVGSGPGQGTFWDRAGNWSDTQGGAGGAGVPTAADDVFVDGGGDLVINTNAVCLSFNQSRPGVTDFRNTTTLTVGSGGFTLTGGTFSTDVSNVVTVAGNVSITGGTFIPGTGTFSLNGTGSQAINSNAAFANLTLNNAAGFTLSTDVTVNNVLTLTSGVVNAGSNNMILGAAGSVVRTSGHVFGRLRKNVATGATSVTFQVGGASAYTPVTVAFGNVTTAGNLTVKSTDGDHYAILSSTIHPAIGANRYWGLTNGGVVFDNYSATFTFTPGDLDPGTNTATFIGGRFFAGSWNPATVGTRTATTTQVTGQTGFGDFIVGNTTATYTIVASASAGGTITPSGSMNFTYGNSQSFTITPNPGYHVDSVVVDGVNEGAITSRDFTSITANHTIAAYFSPDVITISASASAGGSISPSGSVIVGYGSNQAFTITPNTGYHIDSVVVDGVNEGAITSRNFTNVTVNHTIDAYFSPDVMTITASASAGGSISPSGSVPVNYGSNQSFTITPNTGYHIDSVVVNGANQGAVGSYNFTNVTANGTIAAYFSLNTYTITATASAGGSISPSGAVSVNHGADQAFTVTPNTGYHIDSVVADGVNLGAVAGHTFTNVTANHTIDAYFSIDVFTITATASAGGSISPSGSVNVNYGADQAFTVTPNTGYHIDSVVADGVNLGAVAGHTFTNVTANHTIDAYFSIDVFTITASASAGGSISPSGAVSVNYGSNQSFTIAPDPNYHIDSVVVDGVNQGAVASHDFNAVAANHTIDAYFSIDAFTITATASAGGSISPSGAVSVNYGADQSFTVTPNTGYHIDSVVADGVNLGAVAGHTFTNVTANHTIDAYFSIDVFTITATASAGGSISPSGAVSVNYGADQSFAVTPNTGYHIDSVVADGVNLGAVAGHTFTNVTANHTIDAYFSIDVFTITATASAGGSISPSGSINVGYGGNQSFAIAPDPNHHIDSVVVDGVNLGAVANHDFNNVSASHTIAAYFSIDVMTIAASASAGGSITPSGGVGVNYGGSQSFAITPDPNHHVDSVVVDGVNLGSLANYDFTNVTANHSIAAYFSIDTYVIAAGGNAGGTVSPSGLVPVSHGADQSFTITPATGYYIADVHADTISLGAVGSYTFTNVTANHTLTATFALQTFPIAAVAGPNGSISPAGVTAVGYGMSQGYTITPATGYFIADVHVDSVSVGPVASYTFNNVTAPHLIEATFAIRTFSLNGVAGPNGSISPSGAITVEYGDTVTYTITPATGYFIADVHVDSVSVGPVGTYAFNGVTADHLVEATFALQQFTINASASAGGTISPSGAVTAGYGSTRSFTVAANAGYHLDSVVVDGANLGAVPGYDFTNITANHSIAAFFSVTTYPILATAGAGGTISPSGTVPVAHGADQTFTITPNTGYFIADVHVDTASVGAVTSYTFNGVTAPHTISATFAIRTFTLTAVAGPNGSVTPAGATVADYGDTVVYSITPASGYYIVDVHVDSVSVGPVGTYAFNGVTADHLIEASFAFTDFTITATAGSGGSISPSGAVGASLGGTRTFTITPNAGFHIDSVLVDGSNQGALTSYSFTNVQANHTIAAFFSINVYTITASAGAGGSISPSGSVQVTHGANQSFTIAPATGYYILDVHVDTVSVGAVAGYTFNSVTSNHTITATFGTNALPTAPALASPLDGDTLGEGSLAAMPFAWGASTDADAGDTLRYTVRVTGPGVDFTSAPTTDTAVTLDLSALLTANNDYSWTVLVSDGQAAVASADTFRFHISPFTGVDEDGVLPKAYALGQNYPNPFNPVTAIPFDLPERSTVTLKIYNILGVEVMSLVSDESLPAGFHTRSVDFNGLATGAYFYQLTARGESGQAFDRVMKMMVIR